MFLNNLNFAMLEAEGIFIDREQRCSLFLRETRRPEDIHFSLQWKFLLNFLLVSGKWRSNISLKIGRKESRPACGSMAPVTSVQLRFFRAV